MVGGCPLTMKWQLDRWLRPACILGDHALRRVASSTLARGRLSLAQGVAQLASGSSVARDVQLNDVITLGQDAKLEPYYSGQNHHLLTIALSELFYQFTAT